MKYVSTRAPSKTDFKTEARTFSQVVLEGLAPDGGLYMPGTYPSVAQLLSIFGTQTYPELATSIFSLFIDSSEGSTDITAASLQEIIHGTYTGAMFKSKEITPVSKLGDAMYLLHLSNGPTYAFKDVALQLLANLFMHELKRLGRKLNLLGGTSGDTGPAAEYSVIGINEINLFMTSPDIGLMSPFQAAQMRSLHLPNIFNILVKGGTFDDCQYLVKAIMGDNAFKEEWSIGAVNSVNWARVLAQVVYYFFAYFQVKKGKAIGELVDFVVPTGNFGNACAAHVARMMGLPIRHIVLATNKNDVLHHFLQTGRYLPQGEASPTLSPSMDISKASNAERAVFDSLNGDGGRVAELFSQREGFTLKPEELKVLTEKFGLRSGSCSDTECMQAIRKVHCTYGIVIDPHTACGVKVAADHMLEQMVAVPTIVLETALPVKFEGAIQKALGFTPQRPADVVDLEQRKQRFFTLEKGDVEGLKALIRKHGLK